MTVDLSQFIPSFLEESFEGLELMESGLLNLQAGDSELIHSIFRAAHSIKGGAGTFGFENVTDFTHLVETLLDEMRDGRREITNDDTEILLESVDCIRLLIEAARDGEGYDSNKIEQTSKRLTITLENKSTTEIENNNDSFEERKCTKEKHYIINFVPELSLAKTGNDPIFLLSALAELGKLTVQADSSSLPALNDIDPLELYLSWQLRLISDASIEDIEEIFEWVEDECELDITIDEANQLEKNPEQTTLNNNHKSEESLKQNNDEETQVIATVRSL